MATRQHSRRHTAPRLLLLAAAATAGVGISLALSDTAHADDQPTLRGAIAPLTGQPPAAPAVERDRARPALTTPAREPRRTVEPATAVAAVDHTVHTTASTVRQATDRVDQRTARRPHIGRAVDTTTDLTDRLLDTVEAIPPTLTGGKPAGGNAILPTLLGGVSATTTQTAPEPAAGGPPTPPAASSGAPALPDSPHWQHPTAAAPSTGGNPAHHHTRHAAAVADVAPQRPGGHSPHCGHGTDTQATPTVKPIDGTVTERWAGDPRWQRTITGYIHNHSSRPQRPTPPSG